MKPKKTLALLLALTMALALTACSNPYIKETTFGTDYYEFLKPDYGQEEADLLDEMPSPGFHLDPQEIYDSIEYEERMFYGKYNLYDEESEKEDFLKSAEYMDMEIANNDGEVDKDRVSTLPVAMKLGPTEVYLARYVRDYEWAELTVMTDGGYTDTLYCTYTVSGHTITFTPLAELLELRDESYSVTGYKYTFGERELTYEFEFDGPRITLSNDDGSVTLTGYDFCKDKNASISCYLASDSPMIGNMDHFMLSHYEPDIPLLDKYSCSAYIGHEKGTYKYNLADEAGVRIYDNGLIDFYWTNEDEYGNELVQQYQFVYFGTDPMVLTDGENIYYYTESYTTREMALMGQDMSMEDLIEFENMGESEQQQIVEKKANLLNDLAVAFEASGLNVTINESTGEIAMDSAVLFGVDQSNISAEGKEFLKQFLSVYTGVVLGDEYSDFVSKIMIEGHTDTTGDYDYNLRLSQARADNVLAFCLSDDSGMDAAQLETLVNILHAVGYSYDKPILDENGQVDMAASRRVSFRFVINIGD